MNKGVQAVKSKRKGGGRKERGKRDERERDSLERDTRHREHYGVLGERDQKKKKKREAAVKCEWKKRSWGGKKMQGTRSLLASLQPIMTGIRGAVWLYISFIWVYGYGYI